MKIGIITVQRAPNYGAQLQCYALYSYLRQQGHDVEIIDLLRPFHSAYIKSKKYKPIQTQSIKQIVYKWLRLKIKRLISSDFRDNLEKERLFLQMHQSEFLSFKEKFALFESKMKYSRTYKSIDNLYDNPPSYDVYITGSDQLWNPSQPYCVEPYFLTFVKNGGIKMSYATSIGLSQLPRTTIQQYVGWLRSYKKISIREQTAVKILSNEGLDNIERNIDPTFLVSSQEWKKMAIPPIIDNYLFYFTLSQRVDLLQAALGIAKRNNLKLVYRKKTYKMEIDDSDAIGLIDISPEEWLGLILHASYVVTDSFHGTAFSIIFRKDFSSLIPNESRRGCRISDMLDLFGLNKRLISEEMPMKTFSKIDYTSVDAILQREIEKTQKYLLL